MNVVCVSDTHSLIRPKFAYSSDVLVHAGDWGNTGSVNDLNNFVTWLKSIKNKFEHIVVIAGNHDFIAEEFPEQTKDTFERAGIHYLNDSGVELMGYKFWGSPITPKFYDWAFMRNHGEEIKKHWDLIPKDTDILITHGPPAGILDCNKEGQHCGSPDLLNRVIEIKPRLHIFGHIHEGNGSKRIDKTTFINCSLLDRFYQERFKPFHIGVN